MQVDRSGGFPLPFLSEFQSRLSYSHPDCPILEEDKINKSITFEFPQISTYQQLQPSHWHANQERRCRFPSSTPVCPLVSMHPELEFRVSLRLKSRPASTSSIGKWWTQLFFPIIFWKFFWRQLCRANGMSKFFNGKNRNFKISLDSHKCSASCPGKPWICWRIGIPHLNCLPRRSLTGRTPTRGWSAPYTQIKFISFTDKSEILRDSP